MKNIFLEKEIEIAVDLDDLVLNFTSLELINHTIDNFYKKVESFQLKLNSINDSIKSINGLIKKEMWYIDNGSIDPAKVNLVETYKIDVLHYKEQLEETLLQQNHWKNCLSLLNKIKTFLSLDKID